MTNTEAITHLLAGTNWNAANIAYVLGVPRQQVVDVAHELDDRRLEEDETCQPEYWFAMD